MKESGITILETDNYEIFVEQGGNREVILKDILRVERKILSNNLLQYHPILVNSGFEVIDGQHRLEVAKRNNLTVYFIIMEGGASLKTTQDINTTGSAWTMKNFLDSYVFLKLPIYVKSQNYLNRYKFLTISQFIALSGTSNGSSASQKFRDGLHVFSDESRLQRCMDAIELYEDTAMKISRGTHFQRFMILADRRGVTFDHARMVKQINKNIDIVKRLPNDAYLISEMLGDLYNHKLRPANIVNFNIREIK